MCSVSDSLTASKAAIVFSAVDRSTSQRFFCSAHSDVRPPEPVNTSRTRPAFFLMSFGDFSSRLHSFWALEAKVFAADCAA